jgi:hypothetical protein
MKKLQQILIITIAYLCVGCIDKKINPNATVGGKLTCNIDGKEWKATEASGLNVLDLITITGTSGKGKAMETIQLSIDKTLAVTGTTIDVNDTGNSFASLLTSYTKNVNGQETICSVTEGKIKITLATKSKIEGSFDLVVNDFTGTTADIKISNGQFSVKFLF